MPGEGDEATRNWKVQDGVERSWFDCLAVFRYLLKSADACVLKEIVQVQVQRTGGRACFCVLGGVASGAGKVRAGRACQ